MRMFTGIARVPKHVWDSDPAVRADLERLIERLEGLALDVGLDPESNICLTDGEADVRVGISEEMDEFLREAPGTWRM
nr:hypothetical protein RVX_3160 [Nitratidesulfovibrio sp. HK-II]